MQLLTSVKPIVALVFAISSTLAHAAWKLDPAKSSVNFLSVKKDSIAEVHRFKEVSGSISQSGEFSLDIQLASVDTGIPVRDKNMQESFFEVLKFPVANASGKVGADVLGSLKEGAVLNVETPMLVKLHGYSQDLTARVNVVKLSPTTLWVTSSTPLILNTSGFKLEAGVKKLKELANLPSIAYAVPVTVNLYFENSEPASTTAKKAP